MDQFPASRARRSPPASRDPADQPYDPDLAAAEVAKARGLDPRQVLDEKRRVLRPRG